MTAPCFGALNRERESSGSKPVYRKRFPRGPHSAKSNFFDIPANALRLPLCAIMALGVRLIQVGNNRNDHFRYFLVVRVRLIEVSA